MNQAVLPPSVPIVDLGGLGNSTIPSQIALDIGYACREIGFFYIINHGVDLALQTRLERLSQQFFGLSRDQKMTIAMAHGGSAWRGYFPVGGELTSGKPDLKEGIYFGAELGRNHPLVKAQVPLHGANLFPNEVPELRAVVLAYMAAMTRLGHQLMAAIAASLSLPPDYFAARYTADPFTLFRIFHYPPPASTENDLWGVGEHTDYGVLTILKQDTVGGLEVKSRRGWLNSPPIPNAFICNIGDMLDLMTHGLYRSTPHRVRNTSGRSRLSFPFFFDPNFNVEVKPIPLPAAIPQADDHAERWDKASLHSFQGTYGTYLLNKVGKVFPALKKNVLK